MKLIDNTKLHIKKIAAVAAMTATLVLSATPAYAAAQIAGGNFMTAANNPEQSAWMDPVDANPGQIVEFRIVVQNIGDQNQPRIQVVSTIPSGASANPTVNTDIRLPGGTDATDIKDTATIHVRNGSAQTISLLPGHTRIFGVTNLYNCPQGCDIPDNVANGGMEVGDLGPGQSVQVGFKVILSGTATPTPTPTATPTVTPTPTPSVSPSATPANQNLQCPSGTTFQKVEGNNIICINNNNSQSQTQTQNNNQNVTINNTTPSAAPAVLGTTIVRELPKTGLPLAGVAALALGPVGYAVKRFGKSNVEETDDSVNYIWESRKFKKS
jgi:uncharacterized repeat protein (TIGR01451 family)